MLPTARQKKALQCEFFSFALLFNKQATCKQVRERELAMSCKSKSQARPHTVETTRLFVSSTDALRFGVPPNQKSLATLLSEAGGGVTFVEKVYGMFTIEGNNTESTSNQGIGEFTNVVGDGTQSAETTASLGGPGYNSSSMRMAYNPSAENVISIVKVDFNIHHAIGTASDVYEFRVITDDATSTDPDPVAGTTITVMLDPVSGVALNVVGSCILQLTPGRVVKIHAANTTSGAEEDDLLVTSASMVITKVAEI